MLTKVLINEACNNTRTGLSVCPLLQWLLLINQREQIMIYLGIIINLSSNFISLTPFNCEFGAIPGLFITALIAKCDCPSRFILIDRQICTMMRSIQADYDTI